MPLTDLKTVTRFCDHINAQADDLSKFISIMMKLSYPLMKMFLSKMVDECTLKLVSLDSHSRRKIDANYIQRAQLEAQIEHYNLLMKLMYNDNSIKTHLSNFDASLEINAKPIQSNSGEYQLGITYTISNNDNDRVFIMHLDKLDDYDTFESLPCFLTCSPECMLLSSKTVDDFVTDNIQMHMFMRSLTDPAEQYSSFSERLKEVCRSTIEATNGRSSFVNLFIKLMRSEKTDAMDASTIDVIKKSIDVYMSMLSTGEKYLTSNEFIFLKQTLEPFIEKLKTFISIENKTGCVPLHTPEFTQTSERDEITDKSSTSTQPEDGEQSGENKEVQGHKDDSTKRHRRRHCAIS